MSRLDNSTEREIRRLAIETRFSCREAKWIVEEARNAGFDDPIYIAEECIKAWSAGMPLCPADVARLRDAVNGHEKSAEAK